MLSCKWLCLNRTRTCIHQQPMVDDIPTGLGFHTSQSYSCPDGTWGCWSTNTIHTGTGPIIRNRLFIHLGFLIFRVFWIYSQAFSGRASLADANQWYLRQNVVIVSYFRSFLLSVRYPRTQQSDFGGWRDEKALPSKVCERGAVVCIPYFMSFCTA